MLLELSIKDILDLTITIRYLSSVQVQTQTRSSITLTQSLKDHLHKTFSIKDLGQLSFFVGIEVGYSTDGITLTQEKVTREMLLDCGIQLFKIVATPLLLSLKFTADMGLLIFDPSYYRCILGKLNFLTNTRPDLAYVVKTLIQFMQNPYESHLQALHHVLHYVHSIASQGILLRGSSQHT